MEWLGRRRAAFVPALALAAMAIVLQAVLALTISNVWYRMTVAAVVLSGAAFATIDVGWRELYRLRPRQLAEGAAWAAVLYVLGAAVARICAAIPPLAAQVAEVYAWAGAVPERLVTPLLVVIVLGEEIVWRNAVTLPLAARLGPWRGAIAAAAAFALAHVPLGVPLLLVAALGAGFFWSALVLKTRSAIPALVSHLLWDAAVLFWLPYGSS